MLRHACAACVLMLASAWAGAGELAPILASIRAAYGAPPANGMLQQQGRIHSKLRGDGPMERVWQAPDRFLIRLHYPGGLEERLMVGRNAWQSGQPKDGPFLQAMQLQAARAVLPWNLLDPDAQLTLLGEHPGAGGAPLATLVLALDPPLKLVIDVDTASGRILRSTGVGIGELQFVTEYGDFRRIDGRWLATREEHFAMGQHIGHSTVSAVEYPDRLPPGIFEAPPPPAR